VFVCVCVLIEGRSADYTLTTYSVKNYGCLLSCEDKCKGFCTAADFEGIVLDFDSAEVVFSAEKDDCKQVWYYI